MNAVLPLMLMALRTPRPAAAYMIGLNWPRGAIWTALVLTVAVNVLILSAFFSVIPLQVPGPTPDAPVMSLEVPSPLRMFVVSVGWTILSVHLLTWMGRALGGTGALERVAAVWVLLQALRAAGVLVLMLSALILSPLAGLVGLLVIGLTIWLSAQFVSEAHGFESSWQGLGVLIAVYVGLMIVLMALLTLTGAATSIGA